MIFIIFPSSTRRELISRRENNLLHGDRTRDSGFKVKEGRFR